MTKHTPGPWVKREIEGAFHGTKAYAIEFNEDQEQVVDYVYTEADADLICAAPNLLAALEALVKVNEEHNQSMMEIIGRDPLWNDSYLNAARLAINKAKGNDMKHPIQPLIEDEDGTIRFKANAIVQYLLDHGFTDDREQFAQLIGYSHSGYCDLSYASDETVEGAELMKAGIASNSDAARIQVLENKLAELREAMKEAVGILYGFHPSDLDGRQ